MKKILPISLVFLIVALAGCIGSNNDSVQIDTQTFEHPNPNLDGRIVDVKLVPQDVRAGEEVTADLIVANTGNETITNETIEIKAKVKSLDDYLANLFLKIMSDDKKVRNYTMDFNEEIKPDTVKPISAVFHTQQEIQGKSLAGTYTVTITLSINGQKVDSKVLQITLHPGTPREFTPTPTPTPTITVTPAPTSTLTPTVTFTPTPTPTPVTVAPNGVVIVTRIMNYNFGEPVKQIDAGDALQWNSFDDDTFTLVEMNNKIANITVKPGGRTTYNFTTTGTYKLGLYYNKMRGSLKTQTITVKLNASQ